MNYWIKLALEKLVQIIIGYKSWSAVKDAVMKMFNTDMTGEEKKAVVIAELKVLGVNLSRSFMNLAIEIAVALITKKAIEMGVNKNV